MDSKQRSAPPTGERISREFTVERRSLDEAARTVELAFSSEYGVDRGWGTEILVHSADAMRLDRLRDGGPVLVDHNPKDHVGKVNEVALGTDRKARSVIQFGRSTRATEVFQDVVDGIRSKISVGYIVHKWEVDEDTEVWRATDWEPYEISLVSIPADPTVGVGRSAPNPPDARSPTMNEPTPTPAAPAPVPAQPDIQVITNNVRVAELKRMNDLEAMGKAYARFGAEDLARQCIQEGKSVADLQALIMERVKSTPAPSAEIGLTTQGAKKFSYLRAIRALMNPNDVRIQEAAGYEREVSRAAAQKAGKAERGFVIPTDVLNQRDLITGTTTSTAKGGNLIQTDVLGASFIDVLRNAMVLPKLGARFMTGLVGNVAIPKRTTSVTAYWPGENTAPTEGVNVFGQVTMSPKTLAAYIDIGRRLAIQSSVDVEALVRDDLAQTLAIAIDLAAIGGATTNGPTGVRGTSGIGSVAIGTNGGAPTWASVAALVKEVEIDNALTGSLAFLTNPKVRYKLATTSKQSSGVEGNFILNPSDGSLFGYPLVVSNQVTSALTKGSSSGVCSAMFFGAWGDLIVGQWGGIELIVDPYSLSTAGATRVVAMSELDVCVRHAESFAACLDYTTT